MDFPGNSTFFRTLVCLDVFSEAKRECNAYIVVGSKVIFEILKKSEKKSALAFGRVFNGNCFFIFKNLIFIDFQWKLFCLFSFLSKKSFVRKINANRKCFFKKEIGCREIALTLLFLELRVHILRCCRYGAETHESGMYHSIFLSMGDPTTRSTGKIFTQSESKIKTIY